MVSCLSVLATSNGYFREAMSTQISPDRGPEMQEIKRERW